MYRKTIGFYILIFPANLVNLLNCGNCYVDSLGFSLHVVMLPAIKDRFNSNFYVFHFFFLASFPILEEKH